MIRKTGVGEWYPADGGIGPGGQARFFALLSNKINCKLLHIIIIWYICVVYLMNYGRDKGCLGALDLGEEGLLFR